MRDAARFRYIRARMQVQCKLENYNRGAYIRVFFDKKAVAAFSNYMRCM